MVLPDVLHCCFVHRHGRKIVKPYLESSFPGDSNDMNFSPARAGGPCGQPEPRGSRGQPGPGGSCGPSGPLGLV